MVRLDSNNDKACLAQAAIEGREVDTAHEPTVALTPEVQLLFWNAFERDTALDRSTAGIGRIMRGQS